MISRGITKSDLRDIADSNFRLAGKSLEYWATHSSELEQALEEHSNSFSSLSTLQALQKVFSQKTFSPSYFLINLPDVCEQGSHIGAMLMPFSSLRDKLAQKKNERFKNGYELPVMLLNAKVTSDQGVRLEKAIGEVASNLDLFVQTGRSRRDNAFSFLLFVHILQHEFQQAKFGISLFIDQYSLENASLDDDKIKAISAMSDQERADLIAELDPPAFTIDEVLNTWESIGHHWISHWDQIAESRVGYWDFRTFFPYFVTKHDLSDKEAKNDARTIRVPFELADLSQQIVDSGAYPFETGLDMLSSMLGIKELDATKSDRPLNMLKMIGPVWVVVYDRSVHLYKDLVGFKYIHALLQHQYREFGAIELYGLIDGTATEQVNRLLSSMTAEQLESYDLSRTVLDAPIVMADRKYHQDLADSIAKLSEVLESGSMTNPAKLSEARDEYEELLKFQKSIRAAFGYQKKDNKAGENARTGVYHRIDKVLKLLREHHKSLETHLRSSLKTGYHLSYTPSEQVAWRL